MIIRHCPLPMSNLRKSKRTMKISKLYVLNVIGLSFYGWFCTEKTLLYNDVGLPELEPI